MTDQERDKGKRRLRWVLIAAAIVSAGSVALVLTGMRTPKVTVSSSGVTIENSWFDRTVPLADIRLADVQVVDAVQDSKFATKWRLFGFGIPGHRSGWYRLENGEKAMVILSHGDRAVYVPTNDGYSLLLQADDPSAFADSLRQAAGSR